MTTDKDLAAGVNQSNHQIVMSVIRSIGNLSALSIGGSLAIILVTTILKIELPAIATNLLSAIIGGGIGLSGNLGSFLVKTSPGPSALPAQPVTIDQPADQPIPTSDSGPTKKESVQLD